MNNPASKLEISSEQLRTELQEVKERLSTIESILAYLNRDQLKSIVKEGLNGSAKRRDIVVLCETPKTRGELREALEFNSDQAVDKHLNPLRDHAVLEHTLVEGKQAFVWSRVLKKLRKTDLDEVLK